MKWLALTPSRRACGLFFVCWAILAFPWLSGRVTIPYDAKAVFHAQLQFLSNAFHTGQSPFWNPFTFAGLPQIADPQSLLFSPAALIAWFVENPSFQMLDIYVFALLALGGFAILMFCIDRHYHPTAAALAAICFAFGGAAAWRVQHIAQIQSYAFFAVSLWLMYRAIDRESVVWGALAGLAMAAMMIEPDQVAFLGGYTLTGLLVAHVCGHDEPRTALRRVSRPAIVAALTCIIFAAIPVAITYLFLEGSNRPTVSLAEAARGSLHPASLLTFWVGDLFGATSTSVQYWGPYSAAWNPDELTLSANMSQIYFGVVPALLLLVVGVLRGHAFDRAIRAFTAAAIFSLIYALGRYTPVYAWLYHVMPGVDVFRRPVDATFIFGAMSAILTGYCANLWLTGALRVRGPRGRALEACVIVGIIGIAAALAAHHGQLGSTLKTLALTAALIAVAAGLFGGTLQPATARHVGAAKTGAVAVLACLLLTFDLAINNSANEATGVPPSQVSGVLDTTSKDETLAFLTKNLRHAPGSAWRDRVELLGLGFDWQNVGAVHSIENTLGYNPFRIDLVSRALGARDYNSGPDQRTFSALMPSYRSQLADFLGIRYVASSVPVELIDTRLRDGDLHFVKRTRDAWIYENPRALPRVMMTSSVMQADFDAILTTGNWPKFNPHQTVLLQRADAIRTARTVGGLDVAAIDSAAAATIVHYENTRIVIETRSAKPAFLVVNDIWHPWWTATVDSQPAPIMRANAIFRAIAVPAGNHTVTLAFEPISGAMSDVLARIAPKSATAAPNAAPTAAPSQSR